MSRIQNRILDNETMTNGPQILQQRRRPSASWRGRHQGIRSSFWDKVFNAKTKPATHSGDTHTHTIGNMADTLALSTSCETTHCKTAIE